MKNTKETFEKYVYVNNLIKQSLVEARHYSRRDGAIAKKLFDAMIEDSRMWQEKRDKMRQSDRLLGSW